MTTATKASYRYQKVAYQEYAVYHGLRLLGFITKLGPVWQGRRRTGEKYRYVAETREKLAGRLAEAAAAEVASGQTIDQAAPVKTVDQVIGEILEEMDTQPPPEDAPKPKGKKPRPRTVPSHYHLANSNVWKALPEDPRFQVCKLCGKARPRFGRPPKAVITPPPVQAALFPIDSEATA